MAKKKPKGKKLVREWSRGFRCKVPAEEAGAIIDEIREETGHNDPRELLRRAKDPKCPVHEYFDWDDTSAAKKHRLRQAQNMINAYRPIIVDVITKERDPGTLRLVNVRVPAKSLKKPPKGSRPDEMVSTYLQIQEVRKDDVLVGQVLQEAVNMLRGLIRKYEYVGTTAAAIDILRDMLDDLIDNIDRVA